MKNKLLALALVLIMLFSMAMSVSAADTEGAAVVLDISTGRGSVTVSVYLQGCSGVTNGRLTVGYDAEVLTLADVRTADCYAVDSINDLSAGEVTLAWVGSSLTAEKTLMLTLVLEIAEGSTKDLTYTAREAGIYGADGAVSVAPDSVTINYNAPADVTALQEAIDAANALVSSDYSESSFQAVQDALAYAVQVFANVNATQAEVDAAVKALMDAMEALRPVGTADVTALQEAIAEAEKINSALYTEDSYAAMRSALASAKTILANLEATQDEVDAAAKALQDAIAALELNAPNVPTGDDQHILLWMLVLLISAGGVITAVALLIRSGKGKQVCQFLSLLLVVAMMLSIMPVSSLAVVDGEDKGNTGFLTNIKDILTDDYVIKGEDNSFVGTVKQVFNQILDLKLKQNITSLDDVYAAGDLVRVIVELESAGLLEQGYTMNQIAANGEQVAADTARLLAMQDFVAARIEQIIAESGLTKNPAVIKYHYTVALNGLAVTVPYGTLASIRKIEGVDNAYVASEYNAPEATENVSSPSMYATTESFGSAQTWEELGYSGEGMQIAIIDTGLDVDHPSFAAAPEGAGLTLSDIENVLTELNAYTLFGQTSAVKLTADDLYYSAKVPFGFNYVDCGIDVTHDYDTQGDHGTHVAGIAAANKLDTTDVVGVAPNAQLIVMKVFGQNGGAFSDDILAAIEDSILLGVDVINMSLGAQAGFSEDSVLISEVYGRILENDMILAVAAGNANSAATGNNLGTNLNLTQDPDNGLVNSPATYLAATTVASLDNVAMMMPYFSVGEHKIVYVDVTYYDFADLHSTYQYVVVPGIGDVSDYEGLDLHGKVALVQRGTIDFVTKQKNAYDAGATALVVYDNVEGELLSMFNGEYLPNVFISKADGEKMIAAAVNGEGTMTIQPYGVETAIPSTTSGQLSDFSCWGVTPDMQLVPDVTAPGGFIYSCYTDGAYGTMSGTSMASPHIAGMSALVLQYLRDQYPNFTDAEYHTIAESLVMCTAVPVVDPDGILYSPRKQGAGSANVYSAITSPVYLTSYQKATGELTPKASMGDDPERTGVFVFAFEMNNLTGSEQVYLLDGMLLTDQFLEYEGQEYMSETGRELSGSVSFEFPNANILSGFDFNGNGASDMDDVQYVLDAINGLIPADADMSLDLNKDAVIDTRDAQYLYEVVFDAIEAQRIVTVPANDSVSVTVTVELSEEDMAYMEAHYENGIYVDGFVRAFAQSEDAVDLSLPMVGFYGDWTDARMFDNGWYYDPEANDDDPENDYYYNRYLNVVFATLGDYVSTFGGLGINPYILEDYDPAHNVLSPNGDMYHDYVPDIYISLMRSAELLDFTWTDDATGEELFYEWYAYARKSYYWSGYGMCMPSIYSDACLPFTFFDDNGNLVVEDLQHLTLTIRGYLDDGDLDDIGYTADGDPIPNKEDADDMVQIPVVIDLKAPTMDLDTLVYYTEDGRNYVSFDVEDNYDLAAVVVTTLGGGAYEYIPVNTKLPGVDGEKDSITIDITDFDAGFQVVLCDYGCNESYYQLVNDNYSGLDDSRFYAFRRYSTIESGGYAFGTDAYNGWYSFESADSMMMHTSQSSSGEAIVFAAEYVDGYIFGAQTGPYGYNNLFVMKDGSWDRIPLSSEFEMQKFVYEWPGQSGTYYPLRMIALDMAYDYTTDTMYMLCNALENNYFPEGEINILCELDLETGAVTVLGKIFSSEEVENPETSPEFLALTLACDNDGVLYTVEYNTGKLYSIDKTPAETTSRYGYGTYVANCITTGNSQYYPAAYTQAMAVDHETNRLYWAAYQSMTGTAAFIEFDKQTGSVISMTYTKDNAELVGLFKPWDCGRDIISEAEVESINLSQDALYMTVGQNATLFVSAAPFNANVGEVTWSSDNEDVATVNPYGIVVATGLGNATITASYGDFTAECAVSVSNVSGTLYAYSDGYWLLMDACKPFEANQVVDAMEMDGTVKASAYRGGYLYVAAVSEAYDANFNTLYTTNLYRLNASTLQGELVGSYEGNTTALAFNYADGLMYAMIRDGSDDSVALAIVNMNTAECVIVNTLEDIFNYSRWQYCSGALAIDYDGNFYVNGDNENYEYNLVRFNLDENNEVVNVTEFEGFTAYNWSGDSMVWSERNGGLLHTAGNDLSFVDVSDMENVSVVALGEVRGSGSTVLALAIPITNEPEVESAPITGIQLDPSYSVAENESIRVIPSVMPWNAAGEFTYEIADETIAYVDRNGVVTGLSVGETTLVVTETATGMTASTTIIVLENPGYLYGYFQANLVEMIPLETWGKVSIANPENYGFMQETVYDLTIYAGAYYDGELYAVGMHNSNGKYYMLKISPSNFSYKIVCEAEHLIRAMSFDYTTGTMYVIANDEFNASGLYQMDLDTMELTLISDNDAGAVLVAMAIDETGTIYVADDNGGLFVMDKNNGNLRSTGIFVRSSQYLQSMVYDYNNDTIYWAIGGTIYDVNVDQRTRTAIGDTGCTISAMFTVPDEEPAVPEKLDPAGVVLNEKNTVAVGETLAIDAVVLPVSVSTVDRALIWTTDDASVATVDQNGVITGVSAGQAHITATDAMGNSDTILITVTAEHRYFYGYDELTCSWVRFDKDGIILERWADDETLSPIVAATYFDDTLYAYDKDGYFYTIDTETFQRTLLGNGIHGETTSLEAWDETHNQQVYYVDNVPYVMIDLTYAVVEGRRGPVTKMYGIMMAWSISKWCDDFSYKFVELDQETGEIVDIVIADEQMDDMDMRPSNILYCNGYLYAIDGFITGMVSKIDPVSGDKSIAAICPEYWGDFNGGRSMIQDPLTGEIFAIRDKRTEYIGVQDYDDAYSTSVLVSMNLQIGRADIVATVGTNMRIIGLFIK